MYKLPKPILSKIKELAEEDYCERKKQTINENLHDLCLECVIESSDDIASDMLNYHEPEHLVRMLARFSLIGDVDIAYEISDRAFNYFQEEVLHAYNEEWDKQERYAKDCEDNKPVDEYFENGVKRSDFA